jgi:hypothetical protein
LWLDRSLRTRKAPRSELIVEFIANIFGQQWTLQLHRKAGHLTKPICEVVKSDLLSLGTQASELLLLRFGHLFGQAGAGDQAAVASVHGFVAVGAVKGGLHRVSASVVH